MRSTRLVVAAIAVGFLVALPSLPAGAESYPNLRQGWLVGLGVGGGSADITNGFGGSGRETGIAGSFRLGYAFNPTLSLEAGSNAWVKEESGTTVTASFGGPMLNFYPGAMGLILRGGVGFGTVTHSTDLGNATLTSHESGLGLSIGAAYEFRVTRRFALGPQVDFTWIDLDPANTNHINGSLAACWYFVPKSTSSGK